MKINKVYTTKIIDMNEDGIGVAKINSMVIFVPNTVTGDVADIKIVSCEKNYLIAECLKISEASSYRISDPCNEAETCGGCTLGHISYEYENQIKKNAVISAFRRFGIDYKIVSDTISLNQREKYRNKISLHFSDGKFCYYKKHTNEAVNFTKCFLCPDIFNEIVNYINDNLTLVIDLEPSKLQLRSSSEDGITVSLQCQNNNAGTSDIICQNLTNVLKEKFHIIKTVNIIDKKNSKNNFSFIKEKIGDIDMRFSSESFRQINTPAFEILLEKICELASRSDFSYGADLYCGSGIIGLTLAKKFPKSYFWGIEINQYAINDAECNAACNKIENIKFFCGDAALFKNKIPNDIHPDLITLDPPRAGLSKKMRTDLINLFPESIIYVSCNPQTMARDTAELIKNGYDIIEAIPVNMFPRTRHVETVVLLSKLNTKQHIEVEVKMDELDVTAAESKA